jgi:hypothetical protein
MVVIEMINNEMVDGLMKQSNDNANAVCFSNKIMRDSRY